MHFLRQLLILFSCLAVGEGCVRLLHVQFPSAVIGMLVLTAALRLRIIRLDWIKPASDLLLDNITFFFLPTCVSIILYLDLLRDHWWRLLLAVVAGTVLVLALTGWTYQFLSRRSSRRSHSESSQG
ncbi:MAG: CidA/LrgA family protein [Paludibacteraceae bacterium]|nr:CidA/LrgA family protein [Paludibacteraceae bacterium]